MTINAQNNIFNGSKHKEPRTQAYTKFRKLKHGILKPQISKQINGNKI